MREPQVIGHLSVDFMTPEIFLDLTRTWLKENAFHHVVTVNPEMVVQAERDTDFRRAVAQAEVRVPDGAGLFWAQAYLASAQPLWVSLIRFIGRGVPRVTGVDAVQTLTRLCADTGQQVLLVGGTDQQREGARLKLEKDFPGVVATSLRDRPAVVFVALGAPKQTLWIEAQRAALTQAGVKIAIGVGGALAMLAGETPRAPRLFRRLNLEWAWRLLLEPQRGGRMWRATVTFPLLIKRQKHVFAQARH